MSDKCDSIMATCQNDAGHPGAHWHPRVADEPGVIPLRPDWIVDDDPSETEKIGRDFNAERLAALGDSQPTNGADQ